MRDARVNAPELPEQKEGDRDAARGECHAQRIPRKICLNKPASTRRIASRPTKSEGLRSVVGLTAIAGPAQQLTVVLGCLATLRPGRDVVGVHLRDLKLLVARPANSILKLERPLLH